tara:strand:- start:150 stop:518 length:369 start_codon:yes stop_codon:yes gene_type:complete
MEKRNRIIYYIATGLLSVLMLMSASMYVFNNEMVREVFLQLGFPVFIIYPLAIAKFLGLAAIWSNKSKQLKEWAYAGFFFNTLLAIGAHVSVSDGGQGGAVGGFILVVISYVFYRKTTTVYS